MTRPEPPEPRGPDPFIRSREHWTQVLIPLSYALIGGAIGLLAVAAAVR